MAAELSAIPGVASVELFGDQPPVLRIVAKPMHLATYGLSIDDVARVLRSANLDVPAGSFKSGDQLLLVRTDATVWRPRNIEALELERNVRRGDAARAFYTASVAGLALVVYPSIDEELLPTGDRGVLYIMMQGPDGVGLEYMDRQAAQVAA